MRNFDFYSYGVLRSRDVAMQRLYKRHYTNFNFLNKIMELTISTPALLFSTVSLLMIAFTNRFLAISNLVRELHREFREDPNDKFIILQIRILQKRIKLIRNMQVTIIVSMLMSAVCMLMIFLGEQIIARWLFAGALLLQIIALTISAIEVTQSMNAMEIELHDMKEHLRR
jgi:Protein of unknown function (DUF2721)